MSGRKPLDSIKDKIPALARKPRAARETRRDRDWEQRQRDDPETRQVAFRVCWPNTDVVACQI